LLHTEVDRLAPLECLIVVVAARVETQIPAQRPHVTEERSTHELSRMRDSVVMLAHGLMRYQVAQRRARPNGASRIPHLAPREFADPHQRDHGARLLMPALHVGIQVRTDDQVHTFVVSVRVTRYSI